MRRPGLLILILALAAVLALAYALYTLRTSGSRALLLRAAGQLGYVQDAQIAQVSRCWDVFLHCGAFLFYETDLGGEDFSRRLDALGWRVDSAFTMDGYEVFTKLNLGTRARIRLDGYDALGDRSALPRFTGSRWRLTDPSGASWVVDHYPLADQPGPFALNGRAFERNIVQILYQTR